MLINYNPHFGNKITILLSNFYEVGHGIKKPYRYNFP